MPGTGELTCYKNEFTSGSPNFMPGTPNSAPAPVKPSVYDRVSRILINGSIADSARVARHYTRCYLLWYSPRAQVASR
eukprot:7027118-Pyramimonas_sp.AAC.1